MKVSLNTMKEYTGLELPPVDELAARVNAQLGGVEEVINLGEKYKDAKIVKVIECEKHANADKLSVCKIDAGTGNLVQVVCGAPNVHAGMWAIWLPPSSTVPSTFDDDEPFVLGARELRGVMSNGMMASAKELAIGDDHDGIVEITDADIPQGKTLKEGANFAEVFGLDDTIIDIENKMFTHRPDLFGQLGVAREIYAILRPDTSSDEHAEQHMIPDGWYWTREPFSDATGLSLTVFNDARDLAPRFMAVAMQNVTIGPSPLWLRCELVRWGGKPINNVVDLTNYIMLLTAQPTHAYDYDKLRGHKLGVRMARMGEKAELLNGKTYELTPDDIVIADGEGIVGLAGVMGGGNSEVSADTKNIVLEVATFDMYAVRKSSMRYGLFTDALTRFNKGQSKLQNDRVIAKLMELMGQYTGAIQASSVYDENDFTDQTDTGTLHGEQLVSVKFINERLGLNLSGVMIGNILRAANFAVFKPGDDDDELSITAPFWRTDIELPEDVVEEVGRLYGYDKLPRELPRRSTKPTAKNPYRELVQTVRESLAHAGANEVLTYSFVHERVVKAAGQDGSDAYKLSNALSPDLQYYRLSLTPSLLDKMHGNIKAGYDEFALFEIGRSHSKKAGLDSGGLPVEPARIALTYASKTAQSGAAYYKVKKMLDYMASNLGMQLEYKSLPTGGMTLTAAAPFVEGRTARVVDQASGQAIGIIGEYAPSVRKAFKLPDYVAGFELFTEGLLLAQKSAQDSYKPLSRYPSVERDTCFEIAEEVTYDALVQVFFAALQTENVAIDIKPVDIYKGNGASRHITLRTRLTPYETTLTSETANEIVDAAARMVVEKLGAAII
ncbi:MAG TPA: phenylalanine--tRNA ligase subunit beta [Candidatus Saccharibacteria bacterium]|nr:phenylalanine--tRNA ligase subunit beta [Candidatus Saccharibacteria bacterium]